VHLSGSAENSSSASATLTLQQQQQIQNQMSRSKSASCLSEQDHEEDDDPLMISVSSASTLVLLLHTYIHTYLILLTLMARQGSAEEGGFVPERIKPNLSSSSLSAVTSSARGTHGRDSRTLSTPPAGTQARSCPSCCRPTYVFIFMPTHPPTYIHTYSIQTNTQCIIMRSLWLVGEGAAFCPRTA
jgi:hypothetical protein